MSRTIVKVCGITQVEDAELAAELGTDYLGFIFYQKSPRSMNLTAFREFKKDPPAIPRVYVQVRPTLDELREALQEGFDFFQLHFAAGEEDPSRIESWAATVSPEKLWLAPRIAPGEHFPESLLSCAETFLIDGYREGRFGGTGETGDWKEFRRLTQTHLNKRWILAGGLTPENVTRAIAESGTSAVDVSSGIESSPGKKDHARMKAFFAELSRGT